MKRITLFLALAIIFIIPLFTEASDCDPVTQIQIAVGSTQVCIPRGVSTTNFDCPSGYVLNNSQCVPTPSTVNNCTGGMVAVGTGCACPAGTIWTDGRGRFESGCVSSSAPGVSEITPNICGGAPVNCSAPAGGFTFIDPEICDSGIVGQVGKNGFDPVTGAKACQSAGGSKAWATKETTEALAQCMGGTALATDLTTGKAWTGKTVGPFSINNDPYYVVQFPNGSQVVAGIYANQYNNDSKGDYTDGLLKNAVCSGSSGGFGTPGNASGAVSSLGTKFVTLPTALSKNQTLQSSTNLFNAFAYSVDSLCSSQPAAAQTITVSGSSGGSVSTSAVNASFASSLNSICAIANNLKTTLGQIYNSNVSALASTASPAQAVPAASAKPAIGTPSLQAGQVAPISFANSYNATSQGNPLHIRSAPVTGAEITGDFLYNRRFAVYCSLSGERVSNLTDLWYKLPAGDYVWGGGVKIDEGILIPSCSPAIPFPTVPTAVLSPVSITSITPSSGPSGTSVALSGKGFSPQASNTIYIGKEIQKFLMADGLGNNLKFAVPFNPTPFQGALPPGVYNVYVTNEFGTSNTVTFTVTQ